MNSEIATWARHVRKWKSILELEVFKAFLWNAGFKGGWSRTDVSCLIFILEPMSDNWYLGHLLACFYCLVFSLGLVCWHTLKFWLILRHYVWRFIVAWMMISLSKGFFLPSFCQIVKMGVRCFPSLVDLRLDFSVCKGLIHLSSVLLLGCNPLKVLIKSGDVYSIVMNSSV